MISEHKLYYLGVEGLLLIINISTGTKYNYTIGKNNDKNIISMPKNKQNFKTTSRCSNANNPDNSQAPHTTSKGNTNLS